jgi:methyl-accepting chemotaxis protein
MQGKRRTSSGVKDIRRVFLLAFAMLFLLELALAAIVLRYDKSQNDILLDQRMLFRVREVLTESHKKSQTLAILAAQAVATGDTGLIKSHEELAKPLKIASPAADKSAVKEELNYLDDVRTVMDLLRRKASAFQGDDFYSLNRALEDSAMLLKTDRRALNALKGLFQDDSGEFTLKGAPDATLAKELLQNPDYLKNRSRVDEQFSAFLAAVEVRLFASLEENFQESHFYSNFVQSTLAVLIVVTPFFGWALYHKVSPPLLAFKTQTRKMNDELARVQGELSAALLANEVYKQQREQTQSRPLDAKEPSKDFPSTDAPGDEFDKSILNDFLTRLP